MEITIQNVHPYKTITYVQCPPQKRTIFLDILDAKYSTIISSHQYFLNFPTLFFEMTFCYKVLSNLQVYSFDYFIPCLPNISDHTGTVCLGNNTFSFDNEHDFIQASKIVINYFWSSSFTTWEIHENIWDDKLKQWEKFGFPYERLCHSQDAETLTNQQQIEVLGNQQQIARIYDLNNYVPPNLNT